MRAILSKRTIVLLVVFGVANVAWGQSLDDRVRSVLPTADEERWLEIPWLTNIADARADAERQGKPVLLWVMNGNPLGCG